MRHVKTKSGHIFNATEIEQSVEDLTIELSRAGYSFVQVRPRGDRDYANHTISITYLIDEGPRGLCRADRHLRQYEDARLRHPS